MRRASSGVVADRSMHGPHGLEFHSRSSEALWPTGLTPPHRKRTFFFFFFFLSPWPPPSMVFFLKKGGGPRGRVVIWAIDLKSGMELQPWGPCIDRLATTPEEELLRRCSSTRSPSCRAAPRTPAATGRRVWEPSPEMPALVIIVDEYAELADEAPEAMSDTDSIARLGRALAVTLVAATQRPTQKAMGQARCARRWTRGSASASESAETPT